MKTEIIARKLTSLTSHLTAASPEDEKALDTVRRVLGYNLRSNRQQITATKPPSVELDIAPSKEQIEEFGKFAVSKLPAEDRFIVQRLAGKDVVPVAGIRTDDLRLPINPIEASAEVRWNQKSSEQLGPFLSDDGRSVWFDFYYYEDKLTVRSKNGNVPHFLFSRARRNTWSSILKSHPTVDLQASHVWVLAKLFSNDAGPDEYVGFDIKQGSFTLSNTFQWNGEFLDFNGDFTGKLTVTLVQPKKNAHLVGGCSAAQDISFHYPDQITLEWKNGVLQSISGDKGEFEGYGNKLVFSNFASPPEYGPNHIFVPCQTEPDKWKADFSPSRIFEAKGTAEIKKSFWALPIVKVSNPATLTAPENNGGWGLSLSPHLSAKWIGSNEQQPEANLNDTLLLLYPQALFLSSIKATVNVAFANEIKQEFSCWQLSSENSARIPLLLSYQGEFPLLYYCHATEGESLLIGCGGQIQPDRPVFADGSHLFMKNLQGWVIFQARGAEIKIRALFGDPAALKQPPKPIVLQNALMIVSQPTGLIVEGTLSATVTNSIEQGQITLAHGLLRWKPILPDPYVSNLQTGWGAFERGTSFVSVLYAQISWTRPDVPIVAFKGDLLLAAGVGIKPPSDPSIRSLPVQLDQHTLEEIKKHTITDKRRIEKERIDNVFDDLDRRLSGWKLLDVSTNMDLIGVSVGPGLFQRREFPLSSLMVTTDVSAPRTAFIVKELAVNTPLTMVHVFTVPQVQWEPVRTLSEDQNIAALGWFPEFLGSATDGGPTRLIGISQDLSPIIPDVVVREIRDSFNNGNPAVALTTLSFGLKAGIRLLPNNSASRNADSLDILRPDFPQKQMKGGIQINLLAESGNPKSDSHSPGFEGLMAQTLNGYELFTGIELGLSVLGATLQPEATVETQFNKEFAAGGSNPFVPVTRFDLSGYGASNFSEWDNPGALASIGKVQFKIMVGRTVFEVVKFVSKIYPWGVTVTRTVTIERRGGGGVVRKDTGWQATRAGIFDFRVTGIPANPYVFRPGVFRGCFELKNIRPASNDIIAFSDPANGNNIEIAPVYFDANVQLEGLVNETTTFSKGVLGFIQLSPKPDTTVDPWLPQLLSKEALKKLITDQGAIGGPIDTILNIGNSGFMFRATRFEVDVADNFGTPNFVAVVRGQPALPNNGSWSVVKMAAPGNIADPQEATSADVSKGTPLFIENTWNPPAGDVMNVSGPAGPYRFADAVDLFASQPRYDYDFMQNTGSQAWLFRRPVIAVGTNEISSVLSPAFADPFALFTTKGVFPPIANAIEFPTANYKLIIQAGTGKLRLNTPVNLANPRGPLLMAQDGTNRAVIQYDQSDLQYELNYDNWSAELNTFSIWTSLAGIDKLFGSQFSLRAGTAQQSKLVDVTSLLKPEIRDALSFIPGMEQDQRVKDIDLGMTNADHEIKIAVGYECGIEIDLMSGDVEVKCLPGLPGEPEPFENKKSISLELSAGLETGLTIDVVTGSVSFALDATLGATLQGKIPIAGIFFLVLGLEMEFGWSILPTSSTSVEIAAYVGIGMGGSIGPFRAEGFLAAGLVFVYEDNTPKFGGLVKLEAEVDLKIVAVGITAELRGVYYKGDNPDTPAVETNVDLIDASGEVAVNVSIFLVINISVSYEYSTTIVP